MNKTETRKASRQMLRELPGDYISMSDSGIAERVVSLPEYSAAEIIFAYYSVGAEVDTHSIILDALGKNKKVALPVVLGGGIMEFALVSGIENNLQSGQLAIPEPGGDAERVSVRDGDFLLVPALRFDLDGFRLGQGGGYYDRLLASCCPFSVGLCRERMLIDQAPREEHDIGVKCLVTEIRELRT